MAHDSFLLLMGSRKHFVLIVGRPALVVAAVAYDRDSRLVAAVAIDDALSTSTPLLIHCLFRI